MCNVGLNNLLVLMEKIDYNRLCELFRRYHSFISVGVGVETDNLSFAGSAMQYSMIRESTIKMNVVFHSSNGFNQFVTDIVRLEEISDEEYLRRHNPALQRAWEEYQIILKLTR